MPKKPTSNRLDGLFEGMQDEQSRPPDKTKKKAPSRSADKKAATSAAQPISTKPAARSGLAQTSALPPLESVSIAQRGGSGIPSSMSMAFQMDSRNWATLQVVDETAAREWDPNEQMLVKQVVDQLSHALENARLFQETRSRAEELAVLNEMGRKLTGLLSIEAIAEAVYKYASRLMDTTNLFVSLFNETRQEITPIFVINNRERAQVPPRKLGNGLTDHILRTHESLFIPDDVPGHMKKLGIEVIPLGDSRMAQCWMGVPLLVGDSALGVVGVQNTDSPNVFTERHRDLLIAISSQAAIAIQNARLFEETQRRTKELDTLNQLNQKLSAQLDVSQVLQEIYRGVEHLIDAKNFYIGLYSPEKNEVSFPLNVSESVIDLKIVTIPADKGLTGHVLRTRTPLLIPENVTEAMQKMGIDVVGEPAQCWLGVPLLLGEQVIGVMAAQSYTEPNAYDEHDRDLLMAVAGQAAISIQNARLYAQEQYRRQIADTLVEMARIASSSLNLSDVVNQLLEQLPRLVPFHTASIQLIEPDGRRKQIGGLIREQNHLSALESPPDGFLRLVKEDKLIHEIVMTREVVVLNDTQNDPRWELLPETTTVRSWLGAPLLVGSDVIGILILDENTPNAYSQESAVLVRAFTPQAAISIQNARLFDETQRRAEELTALNRIVSSASQILDLESVLNTVLHQTLDISGFKGGLVSLYDETAKELKLITHHNLPQPIQKSLQVNGFGNSLCEHVYLNHNILALPDLREGAPTDTSGLIANNILAYLGIPIETKGRVIGTLCMFNHEPRQVEPRVLELSRSIGIQIGFAIENAGLFEKTQRSEAELRALFTAMTDVIIVYDNEGRYIRIAPTNPSRLFQPPQDMLGKLISEVLPAGIAQVLLSAISQSLETGETVHVEYPLTINQAEYWFDGSISKLSEEQVFLVARDVTARKQAEGTLRLQSTALETAANTVVLADTNGKITWVNPAFTEQTGYSFEEAIGQTPRLFKSGLHDQSFYKDMWDTILGGSAWRGEVTNRHKSGDTFTVQQTITPVRDANNKITHFASIWQDITERKRQEQALLRRNEYLSATAEIGRLVTSTLDMPTLFSRTVNLVRDRFGFYHAGIFVTEETGFQAILQAATGEAGAEMLRQKHSLQVGSKSVVGGVTESGRAVVVNDTAASESHKFNPLLPETRAEAAIPLRVGSRTIGALDIQSTNPNAFSEDDIAVLQTLADQIAIAIDNARSYELSMQAVKEMREADRLKSQFLANMSHELRTPLNSIIGFSRVILKGIDGATTDLQQQDLLAIHNSGQHLLGLINDILDLSRIEAGKMELTFDEVNLPELIASVMSTTSGLVKDKPITLHRDLPADLPTVRADAMRIRQILLNLLSNAAKFTDEGSITVHASVKDGPTGHPEITVKVTDTGPGIALEDQKKLFQPFSQVDASPTRKSGGSGLGLSISNHLIQMHGGRIGVESAAGTGSTFYFTLPAFRGKNESDILQGNRTILAIDDDPQVISLYERYLQPQGYQVIPLSDPSRAVERARQLKPFAVTLDIMMPGYDGWRVLNELKSDPATRDIPIIVCSIVEEREKGFSLGAADYLVKPILEDDILNSLDRLNADGSIRDVLIVDDDPNDLRLINRMLSEHGRYRPSMAEGGRNGWEAIQSRTPHAVILDLFMPDMDGFALLEKMRSSDKLRDIPVIVVSGGDLTTEQQIQLQDFGQRMIQKSALTEKQLISTLERALKRVRK